MVARVGANLRHIAPTHPAARRCGSLTLPHRRSAPRKPASRQKRQRRTSPPQRRRTNAAGIGVGVAERIGGYAPPRPAPLAAAGVRGERKARANAGGIREKPLAHSLYGWLSSRKGSIWVAFKSAVKMQ
jgi:hypothetical protein